MRDEGVVPTILNALLDSYEIFVQSVLIEGTLPNFNQLTSKLLQEVYWKELGGDQTKIEEALLLKFNNLWRKRTLTKVNILDIQESATTVAKTRSLVQCPKPKKPRVYKSSNFGTKFAKKLGFAKFLIKGKEEASKSEAEGETMNVEEKMKENEVEETVDFFEMVFPNLEMRNSKTPPNCSFSKLSLN